MDRAAAQYAQSFIGRFPFLDGIAVFFGAYMPYVFVIAFVALLFTSRAFPELMPLDRKKRRLQFLLKAVLALLFAWGIILPLIHYGYGRARPFTALGVTPLIAHEATPSFPSSHATVMFTVAFATWQMRKKWGYWFLALATLTSIARVYALLHYPSDIIFGAVLGALAVLAVSHLTRFFETERFHVG